MEKLVGVVVIFVLTCQVTQRRKTQMNMITLNEINLEYCGDNQYTITPLEIITINIDHISAIYSRPYTEFKTNKEKSYTAIEFKNHRIYVKETMQEVLNLIYAEKSYTEVLENTSVKVTKK